MPRRRALELGGEHALEAVRLVDDQRVERRQQPLGAGGASEQRVVDDHELRLGRAPPCPHPEALAPAPTGGGRARGRIGGDARADAAERLAVRVLEAVQVTERIARRPRTQRVDQPLLFLAVAARDLERTRAEVVLLALEHRHRELEPECAEQRGQVALVELVLERARAGRHHDALPGLGRMQHGGQQVGERLPDPGRRLGHQHAAVLERSRHLDRERALPRARLPLDPTAGQRPARRERAFHPVDERHQNTLTSRRWMRPSRKPRPGSRP